jgi:hypothetical protein
MPIVITLPAFGELRGVAEASHQAVHKAAQDFIVWTSPITAYVLLAFLTLAGGVVAARLIQQVFTYTLTSTLWVTQSCSDVLYSLFVRCPRAALRGVLNIRDSFWSMGVPAYERVLEVGVTTSQCPLRSPSRLEADFDSGIHNRPLHKSVVCFVNPVTGKHVGFGTYVKRDNEFFLVTALHVFLPLHRLGQPLLSKAKAGSVTLWKGGIEVIADLTPTFYSRRGDIIYLRLDPRYAARLGLRASPTARWHRGDVVMVLSPPVNPGDEFRSSISVSELGDAFQITHKATTCPGSSGSPLFAGGCVVGMHHSVDLAKSKNLATPLIEPLKYVQESAPRHGGADNEYEHGEANEEWDEYDLSQVKGGVTITQLIKTHGKKVDLSGYTTKTGRWGDMPSDYDDAEELEELYQNRWGESGEAPAAAKSRSCPATRAASPTTFENHSSGISMPPKAPRPESLPIALKASASTVPSPGPSDLTALSATDLERFAKLLSPFLSSQAGNSPIEAPPLKSGVSATRPAEDPPKRRPRADSPAPSRSSSPSTRPRKGRGGKQKNPATGAQPGPPSRSE